MIDELIIVASSRHGVRTLLGVIFWALAISDAAAAGAVGDRSCPGFDLFTNNAVARLEITIGSKEADSLRHEPRDFVRATVGDGQGIFADVAVRLKGSIGSFRPLNEKPGFTLDFDRFKAGQRFHGLRRIHLNNSVEDPSFCNESLGSQLFLEAEVPAARVVPAVVVLNGRKLGLYVLVEGFTEDFLSCHFTNVAGNLFEPDEGHDVNQRLKRTSIHAPKQGRTTLETLSAAAQEADLDRRWESLNQVLEMNRFLTFMAMEVMICHRDGYCLARNNFRIYADAGTGKVLFFPHGMDQLFGSSELPWRPHMAGLVAKAVLETAKGRQQYREHFTALFTNLFQTSVLTNRVNQELLRLRPLVTEAEFSRINEEATLFKQHIVERWRALTLQLAQDELKPIEFHDGVALLSGWVKMDEPSSGNMEQGTGPEGKQSLHIKTGGETLASWRAKALLEPGKYRFEGRVAVTGVLPLPYGLHQGAGLRVGGIARRSQNLVGDGSWHRLEVEFQVNESPAEVEFICELRAKAGEAWFDVSSLRVMKLP